MICGKRQSPQSANSHVKVEKIDPHGFCWGVQSAVDKALRTLAELLPPVYCLHDLVHNSLVVSELERRGMIFVESTKEVPCGAPVMFSAHGVAPAVRDEARERGLRVIDATCPFVERSHRRLEDFARRGTPVVIVGHSAHVEVKGLMGEMHSEECRVISSVEEVASLPFNVEEPVGVVCQTTFSGQEVDDVLSALRERFSLLETSAASDICTATRDRQVAVRKFVRSGGDGVLVLGSPSSSNTRRLADIAGEEGARVLMAETEGDVAACDFAGIDRLGVTAGASTPEDFFSAAMRLIEERFDVETASAWNAAGGTPFPACAARPNDV